MHDYEYALDQRSVVRGACDSEYEVHVLVAGVVGIVVSVGTNVDKHDNWLPWCRRQRKEKNWDAADKCRVLTSLRHAAGFVV